MGGAKRGSVNIRVQNAYATVNHSVDWLISHFHWETHNSAFVSFFVVVLFLFYISFYFVFPFLSISFLGGFLTVMKVAPIVQKMSFKFFEQGNKSNNKEVNK